MKHGISFVLGAAALAFSLVPGAFAQGSGKYHDIKGTWAGSKTTAFAKTHPLFPDGTSKVAMEIDVYKQQDNLFWLTQRWRRDDQPEWDEEYAVGTFHLLEDDEFMITEIGPAPSTGQSGFFVGEMEDGRMYLTYAGIGGGVTYSAVLDRKK
ncbi:MAG: hypothetical protein GY789_09175 [Hyphomicrobiales bacterium]|nr:hypothetical protein [Hyphomicrobiales bacterium]MCP4997219.1 hypothetical protein [Hyphomicrobiales bacterium]